MVTWQLPGVDPDTYEPVDMGRALREVKIETHYARNHYFIEEDQIMRDIGRLGELPVYIIHGRRDLTCPVESSWTLHRALPGSELVIVPMGGHLAGTPEMTDALVTATDAMVRRLF